MRTSVIRAVTENRHYGWVVVVLLGIALAINFALSTYGLAILNVHMGDELGFDRALLGTAYSVFTLMTGFPGPLVAKMIELWGIRTTLVIGNLFLLLGAVAMATVVSKPFAVIAVAGVVIGLANVVGGPITVQASVTRWFNRRRSLAMSLVISGGSVGGIVFPPLLEYTVARTGSWQAGWWLVAALSVLLILLIVFMLAESPEDVGLRPDGARLENDGAKDATIKEHSPRVFQTQEEWRTRDVIRAPAFYWLLFCSIGISAVLTIFLGQGVLHMRDLGFTTETAAYLLSASVTLGLGVRLLTGYVGDRVEPKWLWGIALLFQALGMALFAGASSTALLYLSVFCIGIGDSVGILSLIMVFSNWFGVRAAPFVFGFGSVFSAAFGALAPIVAGYCYDKTGTFSPVFYGIAALCTVSAAIMFVLKPPHISRSVGTVLSESAG